MFLLSKINSKLIRDLNIKSKSKNSPEEIITEFPCEFGLGKDFTDIIPGLFQRSKLLTNTPVSLDKSRNGYSEEQLTAETPVCSYKRKVAWEYTSLLLIECVSFLKCGKTRGKEEIN